ncbi:hypothetical protein [Winogradskyella helgolandensis]|uniref:hypothetical protein n=1 Tax=Winogradskyella helgolandensis TaxID=2697010 RepID=UPI0015C6F7AA|nr:hypothetical protein [Winogradskyella helgolandensis]
MKIRVLTILFLVFLSCKNTTEKEIENVQIVVDSTGLKIEKAEKPIENSKLIAFLENPIDLQDFKKKKGMRFTTSVTNGTEYYSNPKIKDSIFYVYYYPSENLADSRKIDNIVVFKYGENKHRYIDQTENLIELRVFNKDSDLGKANLIGLSKMEMESEFGNDYLTLDNRLIYSEKNKILILELENSKIKSFNYIKLSTEKIDSDLIRKITE